MCGQHHLHAGDPGRHDPALGSGLGLLLQDKIDSMGVLVWQNNAWHQAGTDNAANAAGTLAPASAANAANLAAAPPQQAQQIQQQQQNSEPTGLMVALQSQGMAAPMVKSFLLGEP